MDIFDATSGKNTEKAADAPAIGNSRPFSSGKTFNPLSVDKTKSEPDSGPLAVNIDRSFHIPTRLVP
jgi:hypothetical protein